jgi:hypothetical protein
MRQRRLVRRRPVGLGWLVAGAAGFALVFDQPGEQRWVPDHVPTGGAWRYHSTAAGWFFVLADVSRHFRWPGNHRGDRAHHRRLVRECREWFTGSGSQVFFVEPDGQRNFAMFSDGQRISGTNVDGVYQYQMTVPQCSAQGTWTTQSFSLVDNAGNSQSLNAIQLANVGFPTSFQQIGS